MIMSIITWIILGAVAGWIASIITGTNARVSGAMNIVVGIVGAFIGGFILSLFGQSGTTGQLNIPSLLTAVLGAVVLLALVKAFRRDAV